MSVNKTILRLHKSGDLDAATELEILMHQRAELLDALQEALEMLKAFHGENGWHIYWNNSPEMKRARIAISNVTGRAA